MINRERTGWIKLENVQLPNRKNNEILNQILEPIFVVFAQITVTPLSIFCPLTWKLLHRNKEWINADKRLTITHYSSLKSLLPGIPQGWKSGRCDKGASHPSLSLPHSCICGFSHDPVDRKKHHRFDSHSSLSSYLSHQKKQHFRPQKLSLLSHNSSTINTLQLYASVHRCSLHAFLICVVIYTDISVTWYYIN